MDQKSRNKSSTSTRGMLFVGIGLELLILVVAGSWVGGLLDGRTGSGQLFTAIMILVAFTVWLVHLIFLLKRFQR